LLLVVRVKIGSKLLWAKLSAYVIRTGFEPVTYCLEENNPTHHPASMAAFSEKKGRRFRSL
jgi:hypothetical protein